MVTSSHVTICALAAVTSRASHTAAIVNIGLRMDHPLGRQTTEMWRAASVRTLLVRSRLASTNRTISRVTSSLPSGSILKAVMTHVRLSTVMSRWKVADAERETTAAGDVSQRTKIFTTRRELRSPGQYCKERKRT